MCRSELVISEDELLIYAIESQDKQKAKELLENFFSYIIYSEKFFKKVLRMKKLMRYHERYYGLGVHLNLMKLVNMLY